MADIVRMGVSDGRSLERERVLSVVDENDGEDRLISIKSNKNLKCTHACQFLLHFLMHIDVIMLCRKFELIPT